MPELGPLVCLYRGLLKAGHVRGALDFGGTEPTYDFDEAGRVRGMSLYARNDAHKLIEECMILANVAAARQLKAARVGGLYRVHAVPDEKKLDQLLTQLTSIGVDATLPEEVEPRYLL